MNVESFDTPIIYIDVLTARLFLRTRSFRYSPTMPKVNGSMVNGHERSSNLATSPSCIPRLCWDIRPEGNSAIIHISQICGVGRCWNSRKNCESSSYQLNPCNSFLTPFTSYRWLPIIYIQNAPEDIYVCKIIRAFPSPLLILYRTEVCEFS